MSPFDTISEFCRLSPDRTGVDYMESWMEPGKCCFVFRFANREVATFEIPIARMNNTPLTDIADGIFDWLDKEVDKRHLGPTTEDDGGVI